MTPIQSRHVQPTQLRGVNRDARTVDIVASDFSLDSFNTRIDPNGWDLEQFKKNPVICLQHDSYSALPVASAIPESVRVENGKLLMTPQFPPAGTTDDADEAFGLIAAGVLRGVSVGFEPLEWDDVEELGPDNRPMTVRVYRKQRLMEVSFVTIPSNDNGLVVRARELNADPKELRGRVEKLEALLEANHGEPQVLVKKSLWDERDGYYQRKKPANRASTKVLEKFYKRVLKEEPPADEVHAWERMGQAVEALEEKPAEPEPEPKTDQPPAPEVPPPEAPAEAVAKNADQPQPEPTTESVAEPVTTPPTPAPAAPEPARAAPVPIPLSVLSDLPAKLARSYVDAATEALRRGIPVEDAVGLIDGMNSAVRTSLTHAPHGNP